MPDSLLPPTPAAPAAPVSPAAAPSAARARGLGKLHLQRPAVHFLAVELLDRGLGLIGRRHLDEAEPARTTRLTIRHDRRRFDRAGLAFQTTGPTRRRRRNGMTKIHEAFSSCE